MNQLMILFSKQMLSIFFTLNMPVGNLLSISKRFSFRVTISATIIQNIEVLSFQTTKRSAPKTV